MTDKRYIWLASTLICICLSIGTGMLAYKYAYKEGRKAMYDELVRQLELSATDGIIYLENGRGFRYTQVSAPPVSKPQTAWNNSGQCMNCHGG